MSKDRTMIVIEDCGAGLEEGVLIHIASQIINGQRQSLLEQEYEVEIDMRRITDRLISVGVRPSEK